MIDQLIGLLVLGGGLAGLLGGYVIARTFRSGRRLGILMLWMAAPFAVLAVVLAGSIDPTLPPERARYNLWFAFGLIASLAVVPWVGANAIGAWFGRRAALRRRADNAPQPGPPRHPVRLPEWDRPDAPMVPLDALAARLHDLAARGGLPEDTLPSIGSPSDGWGQGLFSGPDGYVLTTFERGGVSEEIATRNADEILFQALRGAAGQFAMELTRTIKDRGPAILREQHAALARIDLRWAGVFAAQQGMTR